MSDRSLTNNPRKESEHTNEVSQAFGAIASFYDSWYQSPVGGYVWAVETEAIQALLPEPQGGVALEVGVGTGMIATIVQDPSLQFVGVDVAWQMLAIAYQKLQKTENLHLVRSDGEHLPFRRKCFDLALAMTLLEFVPDPDQVLSEIHQCLQPVGYLLLGILSSTNLWAIERRIRSFVQPDVFRFARFPSPWQVIRLLNRNGFSQVQYRGSVYAPTFTPTRWLPRFASLEPTLGTRWLSRALGAFIVFSARRSMLK
ncbi:MAG: class I SAM-dependent methyltransferase [Promethearchaeota archaeon]